MRSRCLVLPLNYSKSLPIAKVVIPVENYSMSTNKPRFFFPATQSVSDRVGELFSFTWSSYAGLRELWWQARGFQAQFPTVKIKEIEDKFFSVPKVPGGIDLKKVILDRDWEKHEYEFSKSLIFGGCTLYESWAESVCKSIFATAMAGKFAKAIQFPIDPLKPAPNGYMKVISAANANASAIMKSEIFPTVSSASSNCWATANEHLIAYRYFKECRNSMIHSSGCATPEVVAAHAALKAVQTNNPSPYRHNFDLPEPTLGEEITLSLRDATLFVTVIRRLIHTFDAALCVHKSAEKIALDRVNLTRSKGSKWHSLPAEKAKLEARVQRLLSAAKIPDAQSIGKITSWLKASGAL